MDYITLFVILILSFTHTSKNYCQMAHLRLLTYNEIDATIEITVGSRGYDSNNAFFYSELHLGSSSLCRACYNRPTIFVLS